MQKTCSCRFLYGPETSEPALQRLHKALEGHQEHRAEICFYRKDGEGPGLPEALPRPRALPRVHWAQWKPGCWSSRCHKLTV